MSGLTTTLATALGLYLLLALFMFGCQRSFLYFPDKTAPEAGQTGVQVVKLLSEPDLELVHLYHPPRALDGPVVVVFHGNAGHAGHRVPKFRALLNAGFGVFFVEYRGYGGNLGRPQALPQKQNTENNIYQGVDIIAEAALQDVIIVNGPDIQQPVARQDNGCQQQCHQDAKIFQSTDEFMPKPPDNDGD